ncbi:hypothetical protein GIX45_26330 [Erwinia sp. CPCC 100877]|nr:hypothetical protein [Erwinia sp. CPCC 100877]
MSRDERMLEVLEQTLTQIEELNTRLEHIEHDLTALDSQQIDMNQYAREMVFATENNNIMG